jgi:hypothetical protein
MSAVEEGLASALEVALKPSWAASQRSLAPEAAEQ